MLVTNEGLWRELSQSISSIHYDCSYEEEVPKNKQRVSIQKGIVIARRNAVYTTFWRRRLVAGDGVGIES